MENQIKNKSWINRHPVLTGLGMFIFFVILISSSLDSAKEKSSSSGEIQSIAQQSQSVEVVNASTKVVEKNSIWWKYSYIFTIKNPTSKNKVINAKIVWYDKEGFAVNDKTEYSLEIPANSEKTFSDFNLIDIDIAPNIQTIKVEI